MASPTCNLILDDAESIRFFTDMRLIFAALPGACESHDWFITDLECDWLRISGDAGLPEEQFRDAPVLIKGEELQDIVQRRDVQFSWAVFSALPKGTKPKRQGHRLPFADGNGDLWTGSPKPQLPEAEFEIVCWDSSCTLLIGLPCDLAECFRSTFPNAHDLDEYNNQS